jgi:hypothetical protein
MYLVQYYYYILIKGCQSSDSLRVRLPVCAKSRVTNGPKGVDCMINDRCIRHYDFDFEILPDTPRARYEHTTPLVVDFSLHFFDILLLL